jgi:putative aminopeptidase FrvX
LDEIAMVVESIGIDGAIRVRALGGLYPWKLGEGPVHLLTSTPIPGVLSFGSVHTESPLSPVVQAKANGLTWPLVRVRTGLSGEELALRGVRPGTRVVLAPERRTLFPMGDLIAGPFLDDRADLVAMLLAMEQVDSPDVRFIASVAEEVGGEGALWAFHDLRPEIAIALELSPLVPDAPIELTATPALWVTDSYSNMPAADIDLIASLGLPVQYQALSRGGSDSSCATSHGLVARPFTLGIPMENSHGFEIMHRDAPQQLANLTHALIQALTAG